MWSWLTVPAINVFSKISGGSPGDVRNKGINKGSCIWISDRPVCLSRPESFFIGQAKTPVEEHERSSADMLWHYDDISTCCVRLKKKPTKMSDSADRYEESITLWRCNISGKQKLANSSMYGKSAALGRHEDDKKLRLMEQVMKKRKWRKLFSMDSITVHTLRRKKSMTTWGFRTITRCEWEQMQMGQLVFHMGKGLTAVSGSWVVGSRVWFPYLVPLPKPSTLSVVSQVQLLRLLPPCL